MKFIVKNVKDKNKDWKVVDLEGDMKLVEVSINRTNKKGETFPSFDLVVNGYNVEGEPWTSSSGKNYLFAPKPPTAGRFGPSKGNNPAIAKNMEKKAADIKVAQENKEQGIKMSSTIRMAVDCAIAEGSVTKENIQEWRAWLWTEWDKEDKDFAPFN